MINFIQNAKWRYAVKKYDATRKVSNNDIDTLKEAIRLTASSYGLQPYKVLLVENPKIKELLQPASWGQSQIVDSSHLFIFATIKNFGEEHIDEYVKNLVETRKISVEDVKGYSDFMKTKINELDNEQRNIWASKQVYIALGNLLAAAAELKIDTTPMEGFEPKKYSEILFMDKLELNPVLVVAVGYRHPEDKNQYLEKVRKSNEDLFINLL
jgi:nitroreductase